MHDVKSSDFKTVADACTLCDMCFMTKCPYVPPHEFDVDFPHLMLRHRAAESKNGLVPFVDRELTKTDRNGMLARFVAPLANFMTAIHNRLSRRVLEHVAHVHRDAALPRYNVKTLVARAAEPVEINRAAPAFGQRKAVLYATCSLNYNDPDLGIIARALLAKNGVETEVVYPACCGMPQLEQGNIAQVADNARKVSSALKPWIAKGYDVVALVPSCALMFKLEWPLSVPKDDPAYEGIKQLAAATFDLTEYIVDIAMRQGLAPGMQPLPGPVALHLACHARAQNMGAKASEMLKLLPQSDDITVIERCSGHGGSWGIKRENFPVALKIGKPVARKTAEVLRAAEDSGKPGFIASECPLAAAHIVQGVERLGGSALKTSPRAWHPVEIFALAYGITRGIGMKRQLTSADILPMEDYERVRDEKRRIIIAAKRARRLAVGPYAAFYFENYDTIWLQVHEMLRIEKGGAAQIEDELRAYNPLIPNGRELVATVMFEIEDAARRASALATFGGVENQMEIRLGGEVIKGEAERDLDYTSAEGKASSVQFVHFNFTPEQIAKFRIPEIEVVLAITHPNYGHMAVMPQAMKQALVTDFN